MVKIDILNITVEITGHRKYELCENFVLHKGDEIKISIMKVDEKYDEDNP